MPLVYHGNNKRRIDDTKLSEASIVITTYGEIGVAEREGKRYTDQLEEYVDEAHHLRNAKTGMHKGDGAELSNYCQ